MVAESKGQLVCISKQQATPTLEQLSWIKPSQFFTFPSVICILQIGIYSFFDRLIRYPVRVTFTNNPGRQVDL